MKQTLDTTLSHVLTGAIVLVLVLLPFHAFLTVWLASFMGHYTALRLWKEGVLALVVLGGVWLLLRDRVLRSGLCKSHLTWLIVGFAILQVLVGLAERAVGRVSLQALAYGWLVDMRFILFFLLVATVTARYDWLRQHWQQVLLLPAFGVVVFGLCQVTILPPNFLEHVGYSHATIDPYETINHNEHYVRILATLRGSNPLGAYLVIVLTALMVLFLKSTGRRQWVYGGFGLSAIVVLFFSYSRSAWIGALISLGIVLWVRLKNWQIKHWLIIGTTALMVLLLGGLIALHNNSGLDNVFLHTEDAATSPSSNAGHARALQEGMRDIVQEPLGRGPGTAGPASVYNYGQVRIAENFFIQIGQEVGWFGLALFLLINALVGGVAVAGSTSYFAAHTVCQPDWAHIHQPSFARLGR